MSEPKTMKELLQWPAAAPEADVARLRELVEDMVDQLFDEGSPNGPLSIRGALLGAARRGYCLGHMRASPQPIPASMEGGSGP